MASTKYPFPIQFRAYAMDVVERALQGWDRLPSLLLSTSTAVVVILLTSISILVMPIASSHHAPLTPPLPRSATTATPVVFNADLNAPLPYHRIVAAYGITGGVNFNGPASTLDSLAAFLPQLQQLGQQYATLDPTHPTQLAIDLVVNVIQPCSDYPQWCSSFDDDATLQAYADFCQQHNLLLFFDLQLGTEPVSDAVMNHLLPFLQKYPFTELALDTEFHFPNSAVGHADAAAYPAYLGWMDASEINWAVTELAQIVQQQHLPRKVLVVHQWDQSVIHNKDQIQRNPDVSIVLQSDGWGYVETKLGDYQVFVQQHLLDYGGYKLFFPYDGDGQYDRPLQTPQEVMQLFPQPLFISYQ